MQAGVVPVDQFLVAYVVVCLRSFVVDYVQFVPVLFKEVADGYVEVVGEGVVFSVPKPPNPIVWASKSVAVAAGKDQCGSLPHRIALSEVVLDVLPEPLHGFMVFRLQNVLGVAWICVKDQDVFCPRIISHHHVFEECHRQIRDRV